MSCSCGGRIEETAARGNRDDCAHEPEEEILALDAFYLEHRRCGELNTGIEQSEKRAIVWATCS